MEMMVDDISNRFDVGFPKKKILMDDMSNTF